MKSRTDFPFYSAIFGISLLYLLLIVGMLGSDLWYAVTHVTWDRLIGILTDEDILSSVKLTLITCTISAVLSLLVAIPCGYLLSRYQFRGKTLLDSVLDIPIVLPPLVVGLSLLILFNKMPPWSGRSIEEMLGNRFTYNVPAVILAQFTVACAFAVRTMRNTFDQISPRAEHIALTLGCNRGRAFCSIVVPRSMAGHFHRGNPRLDPGDGGIWSDPRFCRSDPGQNRSAFFNRVFGDQYRESRGSRDRFSDDGDDRDCGLGRGSNLGQGKRRPVSLLTVSSKELT